MKGVISFARAEMRVNMRCDRERRKEYFPINQKASPQERAKESLSKMTLREKIGQLNQRLYGFSIYERRGNEISLSEEFKEEVERFSGLGVLYGLYRADPWSGKDTSNGLTGELAIKAYNMVQEYVIEHSRLGIPMLLSTECPHGHQALGGYLLPVNLSVGATFNPNLYKEASKVCAKQLREMGVDLALVSMLDILRDPRWGRSEECYGEDPYLASIFAKAAVEGIQEEGVGVVAKHFCAQGEGTGGINASAARIGERELREIHLPAAKACCEANVTGIMAAYNEIDGIPCHANKHLLNDILREELGFHGVVMSDGVAIDQLDVMTGDRVVSGALALKSGIDISLWDTGFARLDEALECGLITMEQIDEAVLRVLTLKYERGLFDHPYLEENDAWTSYTYEEYPQALNLARESIVLLKNDQMLPLDIKHIKKIAVIGPNADEIYHQLGDYTPPVEEEDAVTVLKGIKNYCKEHSSDIEVKFARGCNLFTGSKEMLEEAVGLAKECDVTILVLGGSSSRFQGAKFDANGAAITDTEVHMDCGEGVDCADLKLPGWQEELAKALSKTATKVVSILIQGRPYEISLITECSKGVLCGFYPGIKGGQAIAEILFGDISPSGRLPVSIPRHAGQVPVYYNYKSSYQAMNYYDIDKAPLFSFGYGLSYTSFEYSDLEIAMGEKIKSGNDEFHTISIADVKEKGIDINFEISNTGSYDSYAIPQLYVKHKQASVIPRVRELKDFKKVWLARGERIKCTLHLDEEKLSLWNTSMKHELEPGLVEVHVSDSGKEIGKVMIKISL